MSILSHQLHEILSGLDSNDITNDITSSSSSILPLLPPSSPEQKHIQALRNELKEQLSLNHTTYSLLFDSTERLETTREKTDPINHPDHSLLLTTLDSYFCFGVVSLQLLAFGWVLSPNWATRIEQLDLFVQSLTLSFPPQVAICPSSPNGGRREFQRKEVLEHASPIHSPDNHPYRTLLEVLQTAYLGIQAMTDQEGNGEEMDWTLLESHRQAILNAFAFVQEGREKKERASQSEDKHQSSDAPTTTASTSSLGTINSERAGVTYIYQALALGETLQNGMNRVMTNESFSRENVHIRKELVREIASIQQQKDKNTPTEIVGEQLDIQNEPRPRVQKTPWMDRTKSVLPFQELLRVSANDCEIFE